MRKLPFVAVVTSLGLAVAVATIAPGFAPTEAEAQTRSAKKSKKAKKAKAGGAVTVASSGKSCGTFKYMSGGKCLDARDKKAAK